MHPYRFRGLAYLVGIAPWTGLSSALTSEVACAQVADSVPVGTVLAYAGVLSALPKNWLLCDGSLYSMKRYPRLYHAIQDFWGRPHNIEADSARLPNMVGMFLRGDDPTGLVDIESADRTASAENGVAGANVGSRQDWTTGLPVKGFGTSDESNRHSHPVTSNNMRKEGGNTFGANTERGFVCCATVTVQPNTSQHHHTVTGGGDGESRPVNAAVYWIIRAE